MTVRKKSFKMHLKKGDMVKVISGDNKSKIGEITQISPRNTQVVVKGVNIKTKHIKPNKEEEAGRIEQREFPVHSSNVMIYNNNTAIASRIRYVINNEGKKVRKFIKNHQIID